MAAALQLLFKYDWDDCLDAYTSDVEAKATTAQVSSLFWAPPQQRHIALLRESDDVLKTYGLEYEAPAKSGHKESGNMARRRLYMNMLLDCAVASSVQAGQIGLAESDTLEWYQFTLRRMSCNHVERVAAYVKDKKCFMKAAGKSTSENNSASDALIHRDVLFIVFVGLAVKQAHGPSMKDLYTSDHPLVPPQCLPLVLWPKFYADMCASPDEEVRESVTSYARQLIRFLIPSYAFALGPIPDPSLWKFDFTVEDVENLYHGECTDPRLKKVTDALTKRQCSGFPDDWKGTNDAHELRRRMWNLAYSIHVLLWGLHSNDRRLLDLLDTNHSLLKELDTRYERRMCGSDTTCILFVLKTRRASMAARECGCAMRPPWLLPTSEATAGDCLKHFFYEHQLLGSVSKLDSEGIEEDIRAEVSNWDDERLFSVLWTHCTDRVRLIDAESHGSHSLKKHWESAKALFPQQQQLAKFRLALTLGSDLATSDPRQGEGYDRIVHILTASIRKLVLDVRLCHENVSRMGTKYWRYSGGEQSVITIPFGCNIIVLREVHPKRLNNCSIVDIGMDLAGLYRVREDDSNMTQVCQLEKIESAPIVDPDRKEDPGEIDSYQPLRQFLVETARARGGSFVLHGFCESTVEGVHERKVHEVKITVLNRDGLGNQFEDLSFLVRVDSDDVQEATTITSAVSVGHGAGQRSCAFLRLGIQLNNAALGIKPKHRVHESAQCLAAALDGENMFESDPRQVMSADHRSRAMQMSPLMLKFLPRTNEKLKQFHREHIASQMECLLTLFDPDGVRVLGLAIGELSFAKMVLQDASYTVISVNVDDLSFATHYDAIKNLGTMAALSILHLTITSTLPTANIERLVNLTRKTSIRFLIELNPTTLPFFTDSSISSCPAQVLQSSLTLVAGESSMGKLMTKTSALILDAQDLELLRRLLDESKDTIAWAKTQHDALVLHEVSKRHARSRICIVASGHHSVVMSGDVAGTDLIRDINRDPDQHRHIQRLMWDNADTSIVVSVHSIDIASITTHLHASPLSSLSFIGRISSWRFATQAMRALPPCLAVAETN